MDNYLNRSKYKKVSIFRRTKRIQNYESLRIKASRLCPKSEFQDVLGQKYLTKNQLNIFRQNKNPVDFSY